MHTFGRLLRKKEGWRLLAGTLKEKQKNSPPKNLLLIASHKLELNFSMD
jgi:hypothetical protein